MSKENEGHSINVSKSLQNALHSTTMFFVLTACIYAFGSIVLKLSVESLRMILWVCMVPFALFMTIYFVLLSRHCLRTHKSKGQNKK